MSVLLLRALPRISARGTQAVSIHSTSKTYLRSLLPIRTCSSGPTSNAKLLVGRVPLLKTPPRASLSCSFSLSTPTEEELRRRLAEFRSSAPPTLPKLASEGSETKPEQIRKHFFFRFLDYLKGYNAVLERVLRKVLPAKAVEISQMFLSGVRLIVRDMSEFASVYHILSATSDWKKGCRSLSRRQLELYQRLPSELYAVAPVLTLSALPLMQNVVFPLAMMFPKHLLSSHFWSKDLKRDVQIEIVKRRHKAYRPLLREFQKTLAPVKGKPYYHSCKRILGRLSRGEGHPTAEEILEVKALFEANNAFHLSKMSSRHINNLMKVNGLKDKLWWRYNLQQHGNLVKEIDLAILREGPSKLNDEDLMSCCFARGLNAFDLSREDMVEYLTHWLEVSSRLDEKTTSLLLHLPLLIGYNHKTRVWDDDSVN